MTGELRGTLVIFEVQKPTAYLDSKLGDDLIRKPDDEQEDFDTTLEVKISADSSLLQGFDEALRIFAIHVRDTAPVSVASSSPLHAQLFSQHFGCPLKTVEELGYVA